MQALRYVPQGRVRVLDAVEAHGQFQVHVLVVKDILTQHVQEIDGRLLVEAQKHVGQAAVVEGLQTFTVDFQRLGEEGGGLGEFAFLNFLTALRDVLEDLFVELLEGLQRVAGFS